MRPCFTFIVVLLARLTHYRKKQEQQQQQGRQRVKNTHFRLCVIDFVTIIYYQSFQLHMYRIAEERVTLTHSHREVAPVYS